MNFDIIGDVHGCYAELVALLYRLGYNEALVHPEGRKLVFVGDLIDRGPDSVKCLKLAMAASELGHVVLMGNHEWFLKAWLVDGKPQSLKGGHDTTVRELAGEPSEWLGKLGHWLQARPIAITMFGGQVEVVHAAMPAKYQAEGLVGKAARQREQHAIHGPNEAWVNEYNGERIVVVGHKSGRDVRFEGLNGRVIMIDTGCVYGGALTALRVDGPEFENMRIVSQKAFAMYNGDHPEYW